MNQQQQYDMRDVVLRGVPQVDSREAKEVEHMIVAQTGTSVDIVWMRLPRTNEVKAAAFNQRGGRLVALSLPLPNDVVRSTWATRVNLYAVPSYLRGSTFESLTQKREPWTCLGGPEPIDGFGLSTRGDVVWQDVFCDEYDYSEAL